MTTREFFQNVQSANISDEMNKAAALFIQKLDEKNAKRKSADTKEKRETANRRSIVLKFLSENEGEFTRDAIANATGLSVGQVSAACTALGDAVKKAEVKVDKTKRMVYSIVR